MLDLVPVWRDRGINKERNMKLVRSLVWVALLYSAEGWTFATALKTTLLNQQNGVLCWALRIILTYHRTDQTILTELNTSRQLLGFVRRKLSFLAKQSVMADASW